MTYTITRLPRRGPRKGETWMRGSQSHGTSGGVQTVRADDGDHTLTSRGRSQGSGDRCVGAGLTLNAVGGIGKVMVADLDSAIANAKAQHRADRIAAARDRLMQRVGHSDLAVRF
jgi:hypothetical protein